MAKKGLYANIHARRKAGKAPRKPSSPLAPSKSDFIDSAKNRLTNYKRRYTLSV